MQVGDSLTTVSFLSGDGFNESVYLQYDDGLYVLFDDGKRIIIDTVTGEFNTTFTPGNSL